MGFGPLGTSCSLSLKILFFHWNEGLEPLECFLPLGPFCRSGILVLKFCVLASFVELATVLLLLSSFVEEEVKVCSWTAIVKWKAKSKEKKRVMQVIIEGNVASQAMQNEGTCKNHSRSVSWWFGLKSRKWKGTILWIEYACWFCFWKMEMTRWKVILGEYISYVYRVWLYYNHKEKERESDEIWKEESREIGDLWLLGK